MTIASKIALTAVVAGGLALSTQATPITGSISMNGDETAYTSTGGTGAVDGDLSTAKSIVFNHSFVSTSPAPNGSFTGLGGLSVTMAPFLNINPAQVPGTAIWSVGGFSLVLNTLTTVGTPTQTILTLQGSGTLEDGNTADNTVGTWSAGFTSSGPSGTVTFSWNSSSAAVTPEAGTSVLLLGLGLAALGTYAQFRKQVA